MDYVIIQHLGMAILLQGTSHGNHVHLVSTLTIFFVLKSFTPCYFENENEIFHAYVEAAAISHWLVYYFIQQQRHTMACHDHDSTSIQHVIAFYIKMLLHK